MPTLTANPDLRAILARDLLADAEKRLLSILKTFDIAEQADDQLALDLGFQGSRTNTNRALFALRQVRGGE